MELQVLVLLIAQLLVLQLLELLSFLLKVEVLEFVLRPHFLLSVVLILGNVSPGALPLQLQKRELTKNTLIGPCSSSQQEENILLVPVDVFVFKVLHSSQSANTKFMCVSNANNCPTSTLLQRHQHHTQCHQFYLSLIIAPIDKHLRVLNCHPKGIVHELEHFRRFILHTHRYTMGGKTKKLMK